LLIIYSFLGQSSALTPPKNPLLNTILLLSGLEDCGQRGIDRRGRRDGDPVLARQSLGK
jgi:hypothetical protein